MSTQGTVVIGDVEQDVKEFSNVKSEIMCVRPSLCGCWVLCCGSTGVDLFQIDSQERISLLICSGRFKNPLDRARCCTLLSDQADSAATGHDSGCVRLWRRFSTDQECDLSDSWQETFCLQAHNQIVRDICVVENVLQGGSRSIQLISCSKDSSAKIWNLQDASMIPSQYDRIVLGHSCGVVTCASITQPRCVSESEGGSDNGVACGCEDGTVHFWFQNKSKVWVEMKVLGPLRTCDSVSLASHLGYNSTSAFALAAVVHHHHVSLWEIREETQIQHAGVLQHGRRLKVMIRSCSIRHDNKVVAVCDSQGTIRLWGNSDSGSTFGSQCWRCIHAETVSFGEDLWACAFGPSHLAYVLFYGLQEGEGEAQLRMLDTSSFQPAEIYKDEDENPHETNEMEESRVPTRDLLSSQPASHECFYRGVVEPGESIDKADITSGDAERDGTKWAAYIQRDGRRECIGRFDSAEEAAKAWDEAMLSTFDTQVVALKNISCPLVSEGAVSFSVNQMMIKCCGRLSRTCSTLATRVRQQRELSMQRLERMAAWRP